MKTLPGRRQQRVSTNVLIKLEVGDVSAPSLPPRCHISVFCQRKRAPGWEFIKYHQYVKHKALVNARCFGAKGNRTSVVFLTAVTPYDKNLKMTIRD